jgi:hypothetical protein
MVMAVTAIHLGEHLAVALQHLERTAGNHRKAFTNFEWRRRRLEKP